MIVIIYNPSYYDRRHEDYRDSYFYHTDCSDRRSVIEFVAANLVKHGHTCEYLIFDGEDEVSDKYYDDICKAKYAMEEHAAKVEARKHEATKLRLRKQSEANEREILAKLKAKYE